jgi:hypothetical protein
MKIRLAVRATLGLLVGTTAYEALVALEVIPLGSLPGEGPQGQTIAGLAAAVGIVAAAFLAAALASLSPRRAVLPALLAPAAAAFLVAYFYTFDTYYLPSTMRYADRDFVSPTLVFALAGLAVGAGMLAWLRPRLGLALSSPLILACGLVAWYSGLGH